MRMSAKYQLSIIHALARLLTVPLAAKSLDRLRSGFHHSNESRLRDFDEREKETVKICNGNEFLSLARGFTNKFRIGFIQPGRYVSTFNWKER